MRAKGERAKKTWAQGARATKTLFKTTTKRHIGQAFALQSIEVGKYTHFIRSLCQGAEQSYVGLDINVLLQ